MPELNFCISKILKIPTQKLSIENFGNLQNFNTNSLKYMTHINIKENYLNFCN